MDRAFRLTRRSPARLVRGRKREDLGRASRAAFASGRGTATGPDRQAATARPASKRASRRGRVQKGDRGAGPSDKAGPSHKAEEKRSRGRSASRDGPPSGLAPRDGKAKAWPTHPGERRSAGPGLPARRGIRSGRLFLGDGVGGSSLGGGRPASASSSEVSRSRRHKLNLGKSQSEVTVMTVAAGFSPCVSPFRRRPRDGPLQLSAVSSPGSDGPPLRRDKRDGTGPRVGTWTGTGIWTGTGRPLEVAFLKVTRAAGAAGAADEARRGKRQTALWNLKTRRK